MGANDPKGELGVRAAEHSEGLHAESPRHTRAQHRLHHLGIKQARLSLNEVVFISYSSSVNRSKHAHAGWTRRLTSGTLSEVSLIRLPPGA